MSFKQQTVYSFNLSEGNREYKNEVIVELRFADKNPEGISPRFVILVKGLDPTKSPNIVTKINDINTYTFRNCPHWFGHHLLEQMIYVWSGDIRADAAEKLIYSYFMFCMIYHEELYNTIKEVLPEYIEWFEKIFRPNYKI